MADVATRLRLSRGTIEHLESNRYNQLPGRTFARGYVRNYARILGLPVESVLSEFDRLVPDAPSSTPSDAALPSVRRNKPSPQHLRYALWGALAALLLLAAWWQMPGDQREDEPATIPRQAARPAPSEISQPEERNLEQAEQPAAPAGGDPKPERVAGDEGNNLSASAAEELELSVTSHPVSTADLAPDIGRDVESRAAFTPQNNDPVRERPRPRIEPVNGPTDSLRLRLAHDSWIEIYDRSGARLYYDLAKRGENIELLGTAPFRLVLGYAHDLHIDYNGAPFDLTRYINRDGLARLTLGDAEPTESITPR